MLITTTFAGYKSLVNFVVSTTFVELSSFISLIPLVNMEFYANNYNLCLL